MKRKLLALVVALAVVSMVGCGRNDAALSEKANPTTEAAAATDSAAATEDLSIEENASKKIASTTEELFQIYQNGVQTDSIFPYVEDKEYEYAFVAVGEQEELCLLLKNCEGGDNYIWVYDEKMKEIVPFQINKTVAYDTNSKSFIDYFSSDDGIQTKFLIMNWTVKDYYVYYKNAGYWVFYSRDKFLKRAHSRLVDYEKPINSNNHVQDASVIAINELSLDEEIESYNLDSARDLVNDEGIQAISGLVEYEYDPMFPTCLEINDNPDLAFAEKMKFYPTVIDAYAAYSNKPKEEIAEKNNDIPDVVNKEIPNEEINVSPEAITFEEYKQAPAGSVVTVEGYLKEYRAYEDGTVYSLYLADGADYYYIDGVDDAIGNLQMIVEELEMGSKYKVTGEKSTLSQVWNPVSIEKGNGYDYSSFRDATEDYEYSIAACTEHANEIVSIYNAEIYNIYDDFSLRTVSIISGEAVWEISAETYGAFDWYNESGEKMLECFTSLQVGQRIDVIGKVSNESLGAGMTPIKITVRE